MRAKNSKRGAKILLTVDFLPLHRMRVYNDHASIGAPLLEQDKVAACAATFYVNFPAPLERLNGRRGMSQGRPGASRFDGLIRTDPFDCPTKPVALRFCCRAVL